MIRFDGVVGEAQNSGIFSYSPDPPLEALLDLSKYRCASSKRDEDSEAQSGESTENERAG